jgi:2-methylcitrate dehydratase PrpD
VKIRQAIKGGTHGPVLAALAAYAAHGISQELPISVIHHAKRAIIDWLASAFPGSRLPPATILEEALADDLDRGDAEMVSGRRATARAAALINATASHIVELDDIFRDAIFHPGAPIISAALAVGQTQGVAGARFLRGVIVGYEISTRIGVAVNPSHYKYWHTTGTVGCIGAAAAAAVIYGCSESQIAHALATSTTFASGLQQAFRSSTMSKPLHAGHAADIGVWTAKSALLGLTGAIDILDGPSGFGIAMSNSPDWSGALAGLGVDFNIENITFKTHACCGHTFPALDGVLSMRAAHGLTPENVTRIVIGTTQESIDVAGNASPRDENGAKFSLPFVVASGLIYGKSLRVDAFEPQRLADERIRDVMRRVELEVDHDIQSRFPKQRAARITVTTSDGRHISHFQPMRKGDPELPLTDMELEEKFLELATPSIGALTAERLLRSLWALDQRRNMAGLLKDVRESMAADSKTRSIGEQRQF